MDTCDWPRVEEIAKAVETQARCSLPPMAETWMDFAYFAVRPDLGYVSFLWFETVLIICLYIRLWRRS